MRHLIWLPGKELILCSELHPKSPKGNFYSLCIFDPETGNKQFLNNGITVGGPPRLSPDNKSVLIRGTTFEKSMERDYSSGAIYSVDIETGDAIQIKVKQDCNSSFSSRRNYAYNLWTG